MELVSVVVPIYNVERYLDRCVKSVQNQTYKNIEIILVDDGSPDKCGEMCDSYAEEDARIKVLHKKNGGLSDARNAGLEIAEGKYVLFTDSDDFIAPDLVKECTEQAEKNNSDMVVFDFTRVEDGMEEISTTEIEKSGTYSLKKEPRLLFSSPSAVNKLFRKDLFEKTNIRFPVGKYYEDLGTIPKLLLEAKKIDYIKKSYYYYMIRSGSIMTATKFEKNYVDRTDMIDGILEFYKENNMFEKYHKELEFMAFLNGYFLPSREIILQDRKSPVLKKFKNYIHRTFPDFMNNEYLKESLSHKDKMHLRTIESEQYWIMVFFSKARLLYCSIFHRAR